MLDDFYSGGPNSGLGVSRAFQFANVDGRRDDYRRTAKTKQMSRFVPMDRERPALSLEFAPSGSEAKPLDHNGRALSS